MAGAAASSGHRGGRPLVGRHSVALRRPRRAARARRVSVHADLRAQRRVAPPRHRGQVRRPGRPDRVAADHARPARRRPPAGGAPHHGAFEELIGAAWMAIRCCPVERQPDHLAANLVRDAAYRAFTAPTRRRSATEVSVDPRVLDETPAPTAVSPFEELAGLVADGRRAGMNDTATSTSSATSSGWGHRACSPPSARSRHARSATTATASPPNCGASPSETSACASPGRQ